MNRNIFYKKILLTLALVIFVFVVLCLFRDNTNYSKIEPKGSKEVAKSGIYKEVYRVYGGGVYGGDVYTVYLTDSLTFRKYVGDMDDHEHVAVKCIDQDNK